MLLVILFCSQITVPPKEIKLGLPLHPDRFQPPDLIFGQRFLVVPPALCIPLVHQPVAQQKTIFRLVSGRDFQITMLGKICCRVPKAVFPLPITRFPDHPNAVQLRLALRCKQHTAFFRLCALFCLCALPQVIQPSSKFYAVRCFVLCRNHQIAMLLIVGLCRRKAAVPCCFTAGFPYHPDAVQPHDLALGEGTSAFAFAHPPLSGDPTAKI